ncbi:hypothetical protein ND861_14190 [Leptospira sp. 2 VSF19]|uniref:Uncharacterized protein n=1 Tax=Leptospira soteropolitanensis TaxID=2950025 RepID=A0AAW5VR53_9LEPT|nr:hypothetical protein [Leptospira soteropolitanensis]MCW7493795.1 hypothetical protein [Leptospira soteropolitanensis]MCW7501392.1 hypothetical protein [Leptospira soteropolitanensis]MCW7523422.1 hypothetical protein [Leptospira soteropolitanensis]MCW7527506.1 hypothetical protein [Leptospira soteropolitanensis]MCW7531362.1 hypothetical protein [Leptospira soteropolitanensis]
MESKIADNLESQIVDLYKDKEELETQLGTSDTDMIITEFYQLESELNRLYQFKEKYKRIEVKQIIIESVQSAYIQNHRLSI